MLPLTANPELEPQIKIEIDSDGSEKPDIKEEPDILKHYEKYSSNKVEDIDIDEFSVDSKKSVQAKCNVVAEKESNGDNAPESDINKNESKEDESNSCDFLSPLEYYVQFCLKCKKSFKRHKDKILKKCLECRTNLLFECIICDRMYKSKTNVYSHLKTKYDCRIKPDLHCSHCDYTSIHKGFMKNHMIKKHTGSLNDLKECSKCGRHFKRSVNMTEHQLSCGLSPYLDCYYCDFSTTYKISLKVHMINHITDPNRGAALLDENLKQVTVDPTAEMENLWLQDTLSRQLQNKQEVYSGDKSPKKKYIDLLCRRLIKVYCYKCKRTMAVRRKKFLNCKECETPLLHECGLCSSKFNTCTNAIRHLRDRHSSQDLQNTYVCGLCDKWYDGFKKLSRHENHCGKYARCDLCRFTARNPCLIRRHKDKWHLGPGKSDHHPCPTCGRHMRFYNEKLAGFECSNCRQTKISRR